MGNDRLQGSTGSGLWDLSTSECLHSRAARQGLPQQEDCTVHISEAADLHHLLVSAIIQCKHPLIIYRSIWTVQKFIMSIKGNKCHYHNEHKNESHHGIKRTGGLFSPFLRCEHCALRGQVLTGHAVRKGQPSGCPGSQTPNRLATICLYLPMPATGTAIERDPWGESPGADSGTLR